VKLPQETLNANRFFLDRDSNIYNPNSIANYYHIFSQSLTNKLSPENHNHKSFLSA